MCYNQINYYCSGLKLKNPNSKWSHTTAIPVNNGQRHAFFTKKAYFASKRAFDVAFSFAALLFLAPLMAILCAVILISDGRPVFFVQKRVGRDGKLFNCYKFRTLKKECPSYLEKRNLDAENFLTAYGRVLRSLSLDELPQFFNVLKGDMSIVGPRPMIQKHRNIHALRRKYHVDRLKPGVTGLAQVMGRDTLSDEKKASFDREYYEKCSMQLDAKIIVKTFSVVFRKDGYKEGR
ncbi:MAG: sugar transferase [Eubacteriaceae bacterium]|jgi:O-antigen biosynthesis protein WbqP|nr:sugar transferase [Eubacteriaceae bacterium]